MKILLELLLVGAYFAIAIAQRQSFTADPNTSEVRITLETNHDWSTGSSIPSLEPSDWTQAFSGLHLLNGQGIRGGMVG